MVLSNRRKASEPTLKHVVRPVLMKGQLLYQVASYTQQQVFHKNLEASELLELFSKLQEEKTYKQLDVFTKTKEFTFLFNKKGAFNVTSRSMTKAPVVRDLSHNQKKAYIFQEGQPIPFLVELGIMTPSGQVVAKRYDKFKQINRFIEMVEDVLPTFEGSDEISIIDFGCGKSYLTFAMYYYLVEMKYFKLKVIGLDLKEDVIKWCNQLAKTLGYGGLQFEMGDIGEYTQTQNVDFVVSLHACDTATDLAMQKAVAWGAKVIMSVPCCQHELNAKINCPPLDEFLQYGIIKERMSALMTDAIRANWLKLQGYKVQILEFIDLEHTPKNLMIRGIKLTDAPQNTSKQLQKFQEIQDFIGTDLTIQM